MNGSGNQHPPDLKEVFSDGKSRRNSQKEFSFFLRSSGKSISKIKIQREQQKRRERNENTKQGNENATRPKGRRHQL